MRHIYSSINILHCLLIILGEHELGSIPRTVTSCHTKLKAIQKEYWIIKLILKLSAMKWKKQRQKNCYSMREKKGTKDFKSNLKQRFKPTSNIRFAEYRSSALCYYTLWCDNRKILEVCLAIKVIHERVNHAKIVVYTTCCQLTH